MQAEVDSSRQVRKLESANAARKPDMPLKFYVRKKKKLSQATLGSGACSPSKLKKGSTLLHGNKSIIISDGSEPSMSKIVEDETVLHGGVAEAEPTTINVAEEYAVLHGGVPEGEPTIVNVVEKETVLHGGVADAKPTNIYLEENDDLLISFLQNKTKKQRRRINIRK
ncbi:hypothetical protein L195_g045097 [Trifolium pratense]|uniref:Uncharacterized protein n=1 Tax=Trifolium pratense TaxID=57577 RepID=A0A2K3MDW0_TRIPR|nr:hypothetical protein L195_g045097 [Trifolium pratense]